MNEQKDISYIIVSYSLFQPSFHSLKISILDIIFLCLLGVQDYFGIKRSHKDSSHDAAKKFSLTQNKKCIIFNVTSGLQQVSCFIILMGFTCK